MIEILWDASALVKRYVAEIGSQTVNALFITPQSQLDRCCNTAGIPAVRNTAAQHPRSACSSPLTNGSCVLRKPKALKCLTRKSSRRRISQHAWRRYDRSFNPDHRAGSPQGLLPGATRPLENDMCLGLL